MMQLRHRGKTIEPVLFKSERNLLAKAQAVMEKVAIVPYDGQELAITLAEGLAEFLTPKDTKATTRPAADFSDGEIGV